MGNSVISFREQQSDARGTATVRDSGFSVAENG
jgi:hypothetical protein